ncbi:MAG: E3 binding domain-containing protein [Actinomycetota bacterium]
MATPVIMPQLGETVVEATMSPLVRRLAKEHNVDLSQIAGTGTEVANLGIAVSIEDGLIVPVVKGADTMNLVGR